MQAEPPKSEDEQLGRSRMRRVAEVLARAFDDDPLLAWFVRTDERRQRAIFDLFFETGTHVYAKHDLVHLDATGDAAAIWLPPGVLPSQIPLVVLPRLVGVMLRVTGVRRFPRTLQVQRLVGPRHPQVPHYYLMAIGVLPERQGQGLGSRLMRQMTERCDRERRVAYLENSKETNLAFYRGHGFDLVETLHLPQGPSIWCMRREPGGQSRYPAP